MKWTTLIVGAAMAVPMIFASTTVAGASPLSAPGPYPIPGVAGTSCNLDLHPTTLQAGTVMMSADITCQQAVTEINVTVDDAFVDNVGNGSNDNATEMNTASLTAAVQFPCVPGTHQYAMSVSGQVANPSLGNPVGYDSDPVTFTC